ncbi:MAG: bifunctional proline dehydrogenase/L-glutamate gamma-semialdehyde dehydrogenase PutA [Alphaproteobacteria bacterium]|nr:bifunctional proline dehydrogenase/L-glutamate gamma-semialdehyde dehydrogenase PutA [Alphaproteobacteria bacterium]
MDDAAPFIGAVPAPGGRRGRIDAATRLDETRAVAALLRAARLDEAEAGAVQRTARRLVTAARRRARDGGGLDAFLSEYALSTEEGVVLMCLAEALLRIPDDDTRDALIRDKLADAHWERHLGRSPSILVNASTVGLLLTGRVIGLESGGRDIGGFLGRLVARAGEPVIRAALEQAMRIMGHQFVMGRTIGEALERASGPKMRRYRFSFDMLGEAALTDSDARRYMDAYAGAIAEIGKASGGAGPEQGPGLSVKLSALHPRYSFAQRDRAMAELRPRLAELARLARDRGIALCVDAEEADRLGLSLDLFEAVFADAGLAGWNGFGLAVQAYQKRAVRVIPWLVGLAGAQGQRIMVRLVKGAYWDTEIKRAQEQGLDSYPVYTRKATTDVSYIACIRGLFDAGGRLFPQFATHNAHTVACVQALAPPGAAYEFQRLHGMGEDLYEQIVEDGDAGAKGAARRPCRVYAPVGSHEDLLPYLVRRLLENGANTSFVNRLADEAAPVREIVADPVARVVALEAKPHPHIPAPRAIVGPDRLSAAGLDLSDPLALAPLGGAMADAARRGWQAAPLVAGKPRQGRARDATDPADRRRIIGQVVEAGADDVGPALAAAAAARPGWDAAGAGARAQCLDNAAALMEAEMPALMALAVREGGKTIPDALAEVREAVDFCRYYTAEARARFAAPMALPGPTGERNALSLHGRGVFACISPWNFPMAIFVGQVAAALAAGNAVIAKPAEQTPLCAAAVTRILHRAGVPGDVLHLLPGDGGAIGGALCADDRVAGVAFTGSTETARKIHRALAVRDGAIAPLIAETGGQNAMIADSSALPEQLVRDVVSSAFLSAGQRCSALRVLFLQEDNASRVLDMLCGAMAELTIGDPALLATDIGPVIDDDARAALQAHAGRMAREQTLLYRCTLPDACSAGSFFAPHAFEIDRLDVLEREVFGPVLHVIRYEAGRLDAVIEAVNATGYGLTLGVHSRIDETASHIVSRIRAGNAYVNRGMTGAVVGVQPFGGEGLSGTGPKAGGPHYLPRFAVERTVSENTAAMGGNASLLTLAEDEAGVEDNNA